MKSKEEIRQMSFERYGTDENSFGGQRDGFREGYRMCQEQFKPKWISVDEPPDKRGNYLVTNGKATLICGILNNRTFYGIHGATHWMPLPEKPEIRESVERLEAELQELKSKL